MSDGLCRHRTTDPRSGWSVRGGSPSSGCFPLGSHAQRHSHFGGRFHSRCVAVLPFRAPWSGRLGIALWRSTTTWGLGFRSPFGAVVRHVAELPGGEWPALRLVIQGGQDRGAGALTGLAAGTVVPAATPDRQQHAVSGSSGFLGSEPGVAGSGPAARHMSSLDTEALDRARREITRPGRAAPAEKPGTRSQRPAPNRHRTPPIASKQTETAPPRPSPTQSLHPSSALKTKAQRRNFHTE